MGRGRGNVAEHLPQVDNFHVLNALEKEAQALNVAHQVGGQRAKWEKNRQQRREEENRDDNDARRRKYSRTEKRERRITVIPDVVTPENCRDVLRRGAEPLHDHDYESQLGIKRSRNEDAAAAVKAAIGQESDVATAETVPSPLTRGYRSCSTFRVGTSVDGSENTAGYFVRSGESGAFCLPPDNLVSLRSSHKLVCETYQAAIRKSQLQACRGAGSQEPGYWRDIAVKSNGSGEILAVVNFHPQGMGADELAGVKDGLASVFQSQCPAVRSLYLRPSAARNAAPAEAPAELLYGEPFLEETVGGLLRMRLGPDTLPLPNPSVARPFIDVVRRQLKLGRGGGGGGGVLLDLSCKYGGMFPLAAAGAASKCYVFGDEVNLSEAMYNAADNGVYNCVFSEAALNGPVLRSLLRDTRATSGSISVLVTAAKSALDFGVIRALRIHDKVRRIVYVSGKPDGGHAMANFAALSAVREGAGKQFKLSSVIPIDTLPNTRHCEHVLTWTR